MPTIAIIAGAIVIAIIVFSIIHSARKERERREALAALAARLGFSFDLSRDSSHDDRYAHFEVFRRGHSRVAYNTMTGSHEINGHPHRVVMGDFTYQITTSNGKTTTTHTYYLSYLIIRLPYRGLPDLLIRPEHFFDKIGSALGFDDIDFEDAEFSRKFLVKSADRRFAYDICHPRMIEFLKAYAGAFPAIDMEAGEICLAIDRVRWSPEQFESMLGFAASFIDLWPDHLLAQLAGDPSLRTA